MGKLRILLGQRLMDALHPGIDRLRGQSPLLCFATRVIDGIFEHERPPTGSDTPRPSRQAGYRFFHSLNLTHINARSSPPAILLSYRLGFVIQAGG